MTTPAAAPAPSSPPPAAPPPAAAATGDAAATQVTLAIGGMTCAACVRRVEKSLKKAPGVDDAVVNLATHQAVVTYRPEAATIASITAAVVDAGYRATPPSEATAGADARQAALRLIVAAVAGVPVVVLGMAHGLAVPASRWIQLALSVVVLGWAGAPIYRAAWAALRHGGADMNVLVALGTVTAFALSLVATVAPHVVGHEVYYEAAVAVIGFVLLGRYLEARARRRAGASLGHLRSLVPATAMVVTDDGEVKTPLEKIAPGALVVVRPGQTIPVDGEVVEGSSSVAEAVLTGEAMPLDKGPGDAVFAGTSNAWGRLVVRASRGAADTSLAQVVSAVEAAMGTRAPIARVADRVAAVFTPIVLGAAALTFAIWMVVGGGATAADRLAPALLHAVAVLVVACPCALGLATPTALIVGLGRAAEQGALFRSAAALERLGSIDAVVMDKTGTLTEGQPTLVVEAAAPGQDPRRLLALVAGAEEGSEHPLAGAFLRDAGARGVVTPPATAFASTPGHGVTATVEGHAVVVGSPRFVRAAGIEVDDAALAPVAQRALTPVVAAVDGAFAAVYGVGDAPRAGAVEVVRALDAAGIEVVMLTGDGRAPAEAVAATLGIRHVEAETLPADKAAKVAALRAGGRRVAMVGDGVNDAPALAAADVAIAMGSATDVAAAGADVMLLRDDLRALGGAVRLARRTLRIIRENLFWAFAYNVLALPVAAGALVPITGWSLSPMLASAAMSLSSVSVVLNSLRLRRAR